MSGKFKFSLDGVDATARQFAGIRRQLQELPASINQNIRRVMSRIATVESDLASLGDSQDQSTAANGTAIVTAPAHGGSGVRNVSCNPLSLTPRKTVYCGFTGVLGVDCSKRDSVTDVADGDAFVSVDALRRVKWRVYLLSDDVNLKLDDAQPVIGLIAEDLDEAGLGFFCEYDEVGTPTGVDYTKLSVAALRLAQEAMDEVDELKALVGDLSSRIDRIGEKSSEGSDR